jgi:hypothetical protein
MTREVYDDFGNVYVERYDADGEQVGDVERQDLEGWVFDTCEDVEDNGSWTTTCSKFREIITVDEEGVETIEVEVETEVFTYPVYDDSTGTAAMMGTQICSVVTRELSSGDFDTFERTCDGLRVDNYDGSIWTLATPEGDTQIREEVWGTTEYDSYIMVTTTYDSECDYSVEPQCVPFVEDSTRDFYGRTIIYDENDADGNR